MKIGVFGGTFDPPHIQHVTLATKAIELLELD
ncbi:nicotinic acid mononucleotide adenylyltransferase, partial [Klebsiella pneumoniae]